MLALARGVQDRVSRMAEAQVPSPEASEDEEEFLEPEPPLEAPPMQPATWSLQVAKAERTIFELYRSWRQGVLEISPDFKRLFVWDMRRQVRLVESVLARLPLPAFYLSEENEQKTIVIDGQQRLTTLFRFLDGELELRGLELFPELSGKKFIDLEGRLQRRFENTPLTCFIIQPGTDGEVKFLVFERLNEGGEPLHAQEVRHALFRGKGLELISRLASDTSPGSFRDVAGLHGDDSRMKGEELVLRALAFLDLGPEQYVGNLRAFLNEELTRLNMSTGPESSSELEARFRHALARTKFVFGDHAFRRYIASSGAWVRQINASIMDVVLVGFDRSFPEGKAMSAEAAMLIRERFERLCSDPSFHGATTRTVHTTSAIRRRFDLWMQELGHVA